MADYNWEMTGPPDEVTIATDPEAVASWNNYVEQATSDYGGGYDTPFAPQVIANPVYEDPTYWNSGNVAYQTGGGETAYAESFLRPEEYVSMGYAAPYTAEEIKAAINPENIRYGFENTPYASVRGASDLSAGEYVVDPNTNKFVLDQNGNPIPVPREKAKDGSFDSFMTTYVIPAMLAAGAIGTGLGAAGLIGEGAALAGSGEAGLLGATGETAAAPSFASTVGNLESAVAGNIGTPLTQASTNTALVPFTEGYALPYGQGYIPSSTVQSIATGVGNVPSVATGAALPAEFTFNAALPEVGSLSGTSIGANASLAPQSILGSGLGSGGEIGTSYLLGASGAPATDVFGRLIKASSVGFGGYPADMPPLTFEDLLGNLFGGIPSFGLGKLGLGSLLGAGKGLGGGGAAAKQMAGGSYVPKGMVDYSGILSLLAPKETKKNRSSLLG
jgi:hypothetical protein